jgi:peptide chain release factor 1
VIDDNQLNTNTKYSRRDPDDFRIEWFSGTGKGGQHRNKTQNCCRVHHIPTGLKQECQGRSREANKREAFDALNAMLDQAAENQNRGEMSTMKKAQIGSGMRGDKFRTYRFQDDQVIDHVTGRKATCSKVMKGRFDLLK